VTQQLRESFPDNSASRYLIYDNDSIFSDEVKDVIGSFGIQPKRTAYRSPWQNGTAERWVGSCRRELLDQVIVFGERHLRRLLADYLAYYSAARVHTRLGDSPEGRPIEPRPSSSASVVGLPRVRGLHHWYVWAEAA
jgi:transposase InsO family protein